jgi:hypothetical protein
MASRLATRQHILPPEDHVLLHDAIEHWYDTDKFDDEMVARVKTVFRSVFNLAADTVLMGSALPDAIVLQSPDDKHTFYAIVEAEDDAWEAMELNSDGFITFERSVSFRYILDLVALSAGGLTQMHARWQDLVISLTRPN